MLLNVIGTKLVSFNVADVIVVLSLKLAVSSWSVARLERSGTKDPEQGKTKFLLGAVG